MSGKVLWLGIMVAFAVADAAMGLRPGVTEVNIRRIRVGMPMKEVEAILERFPGACSTGVPPVALRD
jgi:hypothetical protein